MVSDHAYQVVLTATAQALLAAANCGPVGEVEVGTGEAGQGVK